MKINRDINAWYKEEILKKVEDIYVENDKYIISCFKDLESIEKEADELKHALYFIICSFYKNDQVKYYPLYLRKKNEPDKSYCSFAVYLKDGGIKIPLDPLNREEIVMKYNALLIEEDEEAYILLKDNLEKIATQVKDC